MDSEKKRLKKLAKGLVQSALNGTATPQLGGTFGLTGAQGITPATLGLKPVGNLGPVNSNPGVSATLQAGESPLILAPEASGGLDYTMEKQVQKQLSKQAKKAVKKSLIAKAMRDPVKALSRLEFLSGQLRPNDPRRLRAAAVVLGAKLRANDAAVSGGSVAKGVMELGAIDSAAEIANALQDVEVALGIAGSAAPFDPARIDARQQLQNIMSGTSPEQSLSGTQDSRSLTAYTSPTAALGAVLKRTGLGEELVRAEQAVKAAEASGNAAQLSAANERLTLCRLKSAHRMGA